jgi:hypothetical protein
LIGSNGKKVDSFDINSFLRAFSDLQILNTLTRKIKNLLIVNFHVGTLYYVLIRGGVHILEQIFHESREYSSGFSVNILCNIM